MKISKQKLKQIIMEEMQGDYDDYEEAEAIEIGKLDPRFAEWTDKLEIIFVQNGQNINDHSFSEKDWDTEIWTIETPEQYYNRVMGVQEVKKTDCFSRKTFDGKSKCIQDTKGFGKKRANAYVASVRRKKGEIEEDYSKQQKENKTMKISKAELMEIIKEEIMGAMSEEEVVEEVAEEQPLEEMDVASMLSPENIELLGILYKTIEKLVTNGVIPMGVLGAGAGALYNKVAGPQVPPEDMGDK
jgi:hypothetical protein